MSIARPWVIAHRGAAALAPENTLAAFKAAMAVGADAVELDVHLSRDGKLIVMHDETVARTTDGRGAIAELSGAEIRRLDAGGWFDASYAGERVPYLEEVLALDAHPVIELKYGSERYPRIEEAVVYALQEAGRMQDAVVISGNPSPLAALRRLAPELPTLSFPAGTLRPDFDLAGLGRTDVLFAPPRPGLEAMVREATRHGLSVMGTTLGVGGGWDEYLVGQIRAGVAGVFTDDVGRVRPLVDR